VGDPDYGAIGREAPGRRPGVRRAPVPGAQQSDLSSSLGRRGQAERGRNRHYLRARRGRGKHGGPVRARGGPSARGGATTAMIRSVAAPRAAARRAVLGALAVVGLCLAAVALGVSLAACGGTEAAAGPSAEERAILGAWAGQVDAQGVPL